MSPPPPRGSAFWGTLPSWSASLSAKPTVARVMGHRLVDYLIEVARRYGYRKYKMHAQAYLQDFYAQHGFTAQGELFQEAGIDHYLMVREDSAD